MPIKCSRCKGSRVLSDGRTMMRCPECNKPDLVQAKALLRTMPMSSEDEMTRKLSEKLRCEVDKHAVTGGKLLTATERVLELKHRISGYKDLVGTLARALRPYAVQPFGNDARDALAIFMGIDVKELEPGSETLKHHMAVTFYDRWAAL